MLYPVTFTAYSAVICRRETLVPPGTITTTCKNVHTDKLNFAQVVKVPNTAQVYKQ